jgi:GNAT superfamily N-acetyltransferase
VPELVTYPNEALPDALSWQALSFVRVVWPWLDDGRIGDIRELSGPAEEPVHFALVENRLLLSYAAVLRERIEHAGVAYDVRGLSNVFTFPASRRRGHGRRVVEAATAHIRASGADLGLLFTGDALEGFYARSGWEALRGTPLLKGPRGAPRISDALKMMLFVSEKGRAGRRAFETQPLHVEHGW